MAAVVDPTQPQVAAAKLCKRCGATKPLDQFGPDLRRADGRTNWCRPCLAAYMRARRESSPERAARRAEAERRRLEGVKFCRGCQAEKSLAEFAACKESPDGLDARCRACNAKYSSELYARDLERRRAYSREKAREHRKTEARREYERRWREQNAERLRENYRLRQQADPTKGREKALRRRALRAQAVVGEVDLDLLWVRQCGICAICNVRIDPSLAWPDRGSKSIDHVVPLSRGGMHQQANLAWTHLFCNLSKGAGLPTR